MTTNLLNGQNAYGAPDDNASLSASDASNNNRTNALSNKLTSVLSSSYADSETRDALRLLELRGSQNAETTRSNLKFDAQKEVIEANARIVDDFGRVAKQLQRVGALITILNQTCDDMRNHIQLAKQETAPVLEEASTLLARKQETESKQQLLDAFNKHFLVSDEDLTTLTSSAEPVNDDFFRILSKVKQIHKDCEVLLGYENQRLGLDLMEQTTRNLDAGYKKLYNWIQREFKGLDLEDPRTSGSIRRSLRALSERPTLFQNCLDFFGEAREVTLSEAFQKALTDSTIGSTKAIDFSTHDPLRYIGDMLAWVHSSTVSEKEALEGLFISDAAEISRGLNAGRTTEPWARIRRTSSAAVDDEEDHVEEAASFDGRAALNSLMSRNMASVAQILHQRTALTLRNLTDHLSVYKAYNLLLFYEDIFVKLLGTHMESSLGKEQPQYRSQPMAEGQPPNTILDTLSKLQSQALTIFTGYLAEEVESVAPEASTDLLPPVILSTNLTLFSSILRLRAPNLTKDEFGNLYKVVVAPALGICASIAQTLTPRPTRPPAAANGDQDNNNDDDDDDDDDDDILPSFETLIYQLNYLDAVFSAFTALSSEKLLADHIAPPIKQARSQITSLQTQLADLLMDSFLHVSHVDHLSAYLETAAEQGLSASQKRTHMLTKLEESSTALDTFLASAIMDAQDDLGRLRDKNVAKAVVSDVVEKFCEEFETTVEALESVDDAWEKEKATTEDESKGSNGKEELYLRELYPRTISEVRALLS